MFKPLLRNRTITKHWTRFFFQREPIKPLFPSKFIRGQRSPRCTINRCVCARTRVRVCVGSGVKNNTFQVCRATVHVASDVIVTRRCRANDRFHEIARVCAPLEGTYARPQEAGFETFTPEAEFSRSLHRGATSLGPALDARTKLPPACSIHAPPPSPFPFFLLFCLPPLSLSLSLSIPRPFLFVILFFSFFFFSNVSFSLRSPFFLDLFFFSAISIFVPLVFFPFCSLDFLFWTGFHMNLIRGWSIMENVMEEIWRIKYILVVLDSYGLFMLDETRHG